MIAGHPGELSLRKLAAGEPVAPELGAHAQQCPACQARLAGFAAEQQAFMQAVPFEAFARGVERAQVRLRREERASFARRPASLLLAAAVLTGLIAGGAWLATSRTGDGPLERIKGVGGAHVEFVIAATGGAQRTIFPDPTVPERLAVGDRLRLGVSVKQPRFITVLAIDAQGVTSPVYAVPVQSTGAVEYLSDSLELTGSGLERLVVIVSAQALDSAALERQLAGRWREAGNDLLRLAPLSVDGEQFHRVFLKP